MKLYSPTQTGPLHDVRVLDLSRLVAGNMLGEHIREILSELARLP